MKRNLMRIVTGVLAILTVTSTTYAGAEAFTLDNQHSYVLWNIKHMGFSTQTGKWYVNGQVILDKDHPDKSKVNVSIKIADVITGIPALDKHLKEETFFDAEKFPFATFVSDKVNVLSKNTAKVEGTLTLRGVSKPVILNVTLNKFGLNPMNHKNAAGFTATTTIKRSDFGMTTYLPDLGDEVSIQIGAEAFQNKSN